MSVPLIKERKMLSKKRERDGFSFLTSNEVEVQLKDRQTPKYSDKKGSPKKSFALKGVTFNRKINSFNYSFNKFSYADASRFVADQTFIFQSRFKLKIIKNNFLCLLTDNALLFFDKNLSLKSQYKITNPRENSFEKFKELSTGAIAVSGFETFDVLQLLEEGETIRVIFHYEFEERKKTNGIIELSSNVILIAKEKNIYAFEPSLLKLSHILSYPTNVIQCCALFNGKFSVLTKNHFRFYSYYIDPVRLETIDDKNSNKKLCVMQAKERLLLFSNNCIRMIDGRSYKEKCNARCERKVSRIKLVHDELLFVCEGNILNMYSTEDLSVMLSIRISSSKGMVIKEIGSEHILFPLRTNDFLLFNYQKGTIEKEIRFKNVKDVMKPIASKKFEVFFHSKLNIYSVSN